MGNTFKTAFLLTADPAADVHRALFGGQRGMLLALVFAAVMNFVSYFFSDKIALATYRAQPVTREELPRVYQHRRAADAENRACPCRRST